MKKPTNNVLISIYYDLYEYYLNDEVVINAIYYIMRRNNRHIVKSVIRVDLAKLNLLKYSNALVELHTYSNDKLDFFILDNLSNLTHIINILSSLVEHEDILTLNKLDLRKIIEICEKLEEK